MGIFDWGVMGSALPESYANDIKDPIVRALMAAATLPKRAFGASEEMRQGGAYNAGPALEAAMLPMGTGAVAGVPMRAGEAVLGAGPIRGYQPERIISAATKFGDKIYEGQTHAHAYQKFVNETKGTDASAAAAYGGDGFITSNGRFVGREEAQKIAADAFQVPSSTGKRPAQLYAEELGQ